MRYVVSLMVLWFSLLLGASVARAAGKGDDPKRVEARARFEAGSRAYNLREYAAALTEFRAAYVLIGDPTLLFNIAQCERQLRRYQDARKSYQAFLREAKPDASQVEDVQRIISTLDQAIEEEKAAMKAKETTVVAPSPAAPTEPTVMKEPPPPPPRKTKPWVWGVVGAAAVVVAGVAIGLGVGLTRGDRYPSPSEGRINGN